MTRSEQLDKVKDSLNIRGTALDDTLLIFLDEVKYYMAAAGTSDTILESELAIGCIARGVSDLYLDGEFSRYFYQRVSQLSISASEV